MGVRILQFLWTGGWLRFPAVANRPRQNGKPPSRIPPSLYASTSSRFLFDFFFSFASPPTTAARGATSSGATNALARSSLLALVVAACCNTQTQASARSGEGKGRREEGESAPWRAGVPRPSLAFGSA